CKAVEPSARTDAPPVPPVIAASPETVSLRCGVWRKDPVESRSSLRCPLIRHGEVMKIAAFGLCDRGLKRPNNEDFMLLDPELNLYVVCDGVGGRSGGEVASQMAATSLQRTVAQHGAALGAVASGQSHPDGLAALLQSGVEAACKEIHDRGSAKGGTRGMATTCTALLICGGKAVMGHVGDSRLFLHRRQSVSQLSEDHTIAAEAIRRGIITPTQAAESSRGHVVTRALGTQPTVMVDTLVFDVVAGDTLLLCSDGLHGYTPDAAELAPLLSSPMVREIPKRLVDLANGRGGRDNVTTIVIRLEEATDNAEQTERANNVLRNMQTLRHIELMRDLSMAEVVKLQQVFREVAYGPGEQIIREGEVSESLFVLVDGGAQVARGGKLIATLTAGAHFGEMALLNRRPRSASVRTVGPSRLLVADQAHLYHLLQQDGMLAAKFFWKLARTLSLRLDDFYVQEEGTAARGTASLRFGSVTLPLPPQP
ncbi:cyclic nucleotide-binding domain-containing protein, partial [Planctomycetota bacterium]